ncbi:neutral/alkaline non-lysosomal ceramidase N-terminal domain-containing protein [Nakamurella lactea]|uniref:neutral/alkaline non-lysosomal ceramidase N-terminal domain-containing protein n=1 Tax=Nakamurella lactea TaxID=459515 RepID=UPI00042639D0|nr:neutral/alkaline non-lysosomal ceramidase N-terminal domain-containing protein [Nakamurella lactea]
MSDLIPVLRESLPFATVWRPRESSLQVGVAQVDMTPPIGIRARNWGAARIGHATGIHRPLRCGVLALGTPETNTVYIATLDLCTWGTVASFRGMVEPILAGAGIEAEQLLLHLVHNHCGPSIAEADLSLPGTELIPAYRQQVIDAVLDGMSQAQQAMAPSRITWTYGHCQLATNRDLPCGERDLTGFNPEVKADDTLAVGRITDAGGQLTAILANYACHPTTLAFHNSLISPDYIGAAREVVQDALEVPLVFFQGASGELAPRDQYVPGVEIADRNGRQLGFAVLAAVNSMSTAATELVFEGAVESGAPLALWQEHPTDMPAQLSTEHFTVPLQARRPLTAKELSEKWSGIDPVAAAERAKRALVQARGYVEDGVAHHPVWIWRLGDAVIVAQSGEAFSVLQTELRRRHPDRMLFVLNLTNGPGSCYLPTEEAYLHDRYQVWQTLLDPGSLETLIEAIDQALRRLPEPREILT